MASTFGIHSSSLRNFLIVLLVFLFLSSWYFDNDIVSHGRIRRSLISACCLLMKVSACKSRSTNVLLLAYGLSNLSLTIAISAPSWSNTPSIFPMRFSISWTGEISLWIDFSIDHILGCMPSGGASGKTDDSGALRSIAGFSGLPLSLGSRHLMDKQPVGGLSVVASWDAAVPGWPLSASSGSDDMVGCMQGMLWHWSNQCEIVTKSFRWSWNNWVIKSYFSVSVDCFYVC